MAFPLLTLLGMGMGSQDGKTKQLDKKQVVNYSSIQSPKTTYPAQPPIQGQGLAGQYPVLNQMGNIGQNSPVTGATQVVPKNYVEKNPGTTQQAVKPAASSSGSGGFDAMGLISMLGSQSGNKNTSLSPGQAGRTFSPISAPSTSAASLLSNPSLYNR